MKLKSHCCEKYLNKAKACKRCPLTAILSSKKRRKKLKKIKRRLKAA